MLATVLIAALLVAPSAVADPPLRLQDYVTDNANALSGSQRAEVEQAIDRLYTDKRIRLWVVYVDSFAPLSRINWSDDTMRASGFGDYDALLAIAVGDREYNFVPTADLTDSQAKDLQRNGIEPALHDNDWAAAGTLG